MIETIEFNEKLYPAFQASGNAARFIMPFAKEVCRGKGFDIGAGKQEWAFPGAIVIDPAISQYNLQYVGDFTFDFSHVVYDAMTLPDIGVDYIFSSHCLEHINEPWCKVLDYWNTRLYNGGVMFLYLPHPDQEYWLPWNDRKHFHIIHPEDVRKYFESGPYCNIFVSERDLNHSFVAMAQKQ